MDATKTTIVAEVVDMTNEEVQTTSSVESIESDNVEFTENNKIQEKKTHPSNMSIKISVIESKQTSLKNKNSNVDDLKTASLTKRTTGKMNEKSIKL